MDAPNKTGWEGTPRAHEEDVRAEIAALDIFNFLDAVSAVLAVGIDRAAHRVSSRSDSSLREVAVVQGAIRAFRGIRAASAVISSGYALEAEPYTRMLMELYVSTKAIVDDPTNEEAEKWLKGDHARGLGQRVKASIPDPSVYRHLSQATHGDPRALLRALVQTAEDGLTIEWGPAHSPQTEEQLLHLAFAARDFCVLLEHVGFERQAELAAIDATLQRLKPTWRPDKVFENPSQS